MKNIHLVIFVRNLVLLVLKQTSRLLSVRSVFAVLLFIILNLTFNIENCLCQWTWQNPLPQGNHLYNLYLTGNNKLFGAGDFGTIISTSNMGINWNVVNTVNNITGKIEYIEMIDNNTFYFCTMPGGIYKSTNAGLNWILFYNNPGYSFLKMDFIGENIGYANSYTKIFKTTNGGINWAEVFDNPNLYTINDIYFINENTGFHASHFLPDNNMIDVLNRTTNSGLNWTYIQPGPAFITKFINQTTGFGYNTNIIMKSTNSGENWFTVPNGNINNISKLLTISEDIHYAVIKNYIFKVTTNGGYNWIDKVSPVYECNSIKFLNSNTGYIMGDTREIFVTMNAGTNWTSIARKTEGGWLKDYDFIDNNTGFVVGGNANLLKTTNGGLNWINLAENGNLNSYAFTGIDFINVQTGYCLGFISTKNMLLKTTNSGINWTLMDTIDNNTGKIRFFDSSTGFATTGNNKVLRTTNSGLNWSETILPLATNSFGAFILNSATGYITSATGSNNYTIFRTTDKGLSWTILFSDNTTKYDIIFINSNTGFYASNGIYKTTNGGINWWQTFAGPSFPFLAGIEVVQDTIIYASGYEKIYKSINGGLNWYNVYCPTNVRLERIKFFNANTGLIFGENYVIIRTTNGGGNFISGINIIKSEVPDSYSLEQNYPNPFNSVTSIKFKVASVGHPDLSGQTVTLIIFDLLGREIKTLVNEKLNPGTYEVRLDAKDLPSGIYFYRMQTENYISTRKLIIIK